MKQTSTSPKHSSRVCYLGTLVMLASILLPPHLIPPWTDGIAPADVSIACVFVGVIIGILTINDLILHVLSTMGGLATNGIQVPAQVISSSMGASYVWQTVIFHTLCCVIIRGNAGEVVARFLLTRRSTQKYPMVTAIMLLFALGLTAVFMGVLGTLIMDFTLLGGIHIEASIESKSKLARLLCLGTFITMCISPMIIGDMVASNLAAGQFFLAATRVQVVTFRFVAEAFAILITFCVVFVLTLRFPSRCDIRALGRVDLAQALADKPLRLTRRQWTPLAAFLVVILHSLTSPYWPGIPVLSALKEMDIVLSTSVALVALVFIRVNREQIFCPVEAFAKGVSQPIVTAVASMVTISGLLTADGYGIRAWLTQALGDLFSDRSPLLFVAMMVLITLLLVDFFSNTATLLMVSSLVFAPSGPLVDAGHDIAILAVVISLSPMVAYLTYASSDQVVILLSQENTGNKFIWAYSITAVLFHAVVVILVFAACLFF